MLQMSAIAAYFDFGLQTILGRFVAQAAERGEDEAQSKLGSTSMMLLAWSRPAFQRKMTTAHVGSLHRFDLFEKYGNYNTGYKIAGDYELLLRPGKELNSIFVGEVTAAMLAGGNSDCFAALKEAQQAKIGTGGRNLVWAFWELWVERLKLAVRRVGTA
jgi:hypothetical protein